MKTEYEWRLSFDCIENEYYVDLREDKIDSNDDTIEAEYISGHIFNTYHEALVFYETRGKDNYLWLNEVDEDMKTALHDASIGVACLLDQNYDSPEELEKDLFKIQDHITKLERHILKNYEKEKYKTNSV
jgi:hypothetical protein